MEVAMEEESFSARNRRRREENAFENLYGYYRRTGTPEPKRSAQRTARQIHGDGLNGASAVRMDSKRGVPHRLDDRTKEQLYARAQELQIDGRSQMNRDELISAIRSHS
jgi:hypothetical protein